MRVLVPVYYVSSRTHISRRMYAIMQNAYKLVVYNHMNLVRNPRLDPTCFAYCMYMSRRDHHDMTSRSPICMMRRNRSCACT